MPSPGPGMQDSDDDSEREEAFRRDADADADKDSDADGEEGIERNNDDDDEEEAEDEGDATRIFDFTDQSFEELRLPKSQQDELKESWQAFLRVGSREVAGEAIYAAIFESLPSLQGLFKTPRAVLAMRMLNGINQMVTSVHDPKALKITVETLGFQHLDFEVSAPRISVFREAIVDLLAVELGSRMTTAARCGWTSLLNYAGGAFVFVRVKYTDRLKILATSWATANNRSDEDGVPGAKHDGASGGSGNSGGTGELSHEATGVTDAEGNNNIRAKDPDKDDMRDSKSVASRGRPGSKDFSGGESGVGANGKSGGAGEKDAGKKDITVPKTFNEMFNFNAAVMGFGGSTWMNEVLASFDTIVTNMTNSQRLQEECDLISLRVAKYKGIIKLDEFKAVMLASLRSLVPKEWNSAHEVAWGWLWENVERMIKALMGKPAQQKKALERLWSSLDETQLDFVRREIYSRFFALAPAGQDYFKQSTTRQFMITDRIIAMTLDIYKEPKKLVQDISALGLRHVGYGIPTELFGPFVTACVQVVRSLTDDEQAEDAFRWSASLISRILVRVVSEGSTIVMKAINANSGKQLKRAVACAPRGKRSMWMLNVQVGTQAISPLVWAVETGALDAARAIMTDLCTIRADRDTYYYGADQLFPRHPDIVKRLCADAPGLLPVLLDGLIWRSRITVQGQRRVNYYFKNLLIDEEGGFAKNIEWLVDFADPRMVCHPIVALVMDTVWARVASRIFLTRKLWSIITLLVFIASHSILRNIDRGAQGFEIRIANFAFRLFVYLFSMGQLVYAHTRMACNEIRARKFVKFGCIYIPEYLTNWQDAIGLVLTAVLLLMCAIEPIFYCLNTGAVTGTAEEDSEESLFRDDCEAAKHMHFSYSVLSMIAMGIYFALLVDLTVFSHRVSAFVLVCGRVLVEVLLFIGALAFFIATFCCSVTALDHNNESYRTIPEAAKALLEISLNMYGEAHFETLNDEPVLLVAVGVFLVCTMVFLLNLLIAQLNCSYQSTYQDMLGYARLNRGRIVVDSMAGCSHKRWVSFVESLNLDTRLEFGEGDVGLPGGISLFEPAASNPTTEDQVRRYGGSTSAAMPWPDDDNKENDDEDRLDRIEKMLAKTLKKVGRENSRKRGIQSSGVAGSSSMNASSRSDSMGSESEDKVQRQVS